MAFGGGMIRKGEKMKDRTWWQIFFCMMLFGIFYSSLLFSVNTRAAIHSVNDIGLYPSGTNYDSVVGVRVRVDEKLVGYAVDTWKRSETGSWTYQGTNHDGIEGKIGTKISDKNIVWLREQPSDLTRFGVNIGNLKKERSALGISYCFPEEYSVVYLKFQKGKIEKRYVEYSYEDDAILNSNEYSLTRMIKYFSTSSLNIGTYEGDGASYTYDIYTALSIGESGAIPVVAGDCKISGVGKAFYNGEDYFIRSLPQVTAEQIGYQTTFLGWFDRPSGGNLYQIGDRIQKGTILYPQVSKVPKQYSVTCIDMIDGKQIGKSSWTQAYGELARGSQAGCLPAAGIYYDGIVYTGCSEILVKDTGNTVYRYFAYADYPVLVIDLITSGPNQGKQLTATSFSKPFRSTVSGGELLGADSEEGFYYLGYQYVSDCSAVVDRNGVTVYRYFEPVTYDIVFHGSSETGGSMAPMEQCYFDETYHLNHNRYTKKVTITLDLQSADAVCETAEIKANQLFSGWSEQLDGTVRYSDGCEIRNLLSKAGRKDLYAVWDEAYISIVPIPVRRGYQFAGWSVNQNALQGSTDFMVNKDMTLYAIWKPNVADYHVEYYKENASGTYDLAAQYTFNSYIGKGVSIEEGATTTYPGYYLDRSSSQLTGEVREDNSLILTAYYRRNVYTLSFDLCGGRKEGEDAFAVISGKFEEEIQIPEFVPQKEGYDFVGWTAEKNGAQKYCDVGEQYHIPNHNQILYAMWQGKKDIPFELILEKEGLGKEEIKEETRVLTGCTDQTVENAMKAYYGCESIKNFMDGYEIVNPLELQNSVIAGDGSTVVRVRLRRRQYPVGIVLDLHRENNTLLTESTVRYQETYTLPAELPEVQSVSYYQNSEGKIYRAGESIKITKPTVLMPLRKITYHLGRENIEQFVAHQGIAMLLHPEETVYRFESWYWEDECLRLAGKAKEALNVQSDIHLYAKWSFEKIVYQIQYDLSNQKELVLLDGEVDSYCSGDLVTLPVAAQMLIPKGYLFVGWYEKGDNSRTLIRTLSEGAYGDKVFCPLLKKESGSLSQNHKVSDQKNTKKEVFSLKQSLKDSDIKKKQPVKKRKFIKNSICYSILKASGKKKVQVIGAKTGIRIARIPKNVRWNGNTYQVVKIKKRAFYHCKSLRKVWIGANVRQIGKKAFYQAKKVQIIKILGGKVKQIGKKAFWTGAKKTKYVMPRGKWKQYCSKLRKSGIRGRIIKAK